MITKLFRKITNALPYLVILYLAWMWIPVAFRHFRSEGQASGAFQILSLNGQTLDSAKLPRPVLLAFWATWCGPCTIELNRIQRLIDNHAIDKNSVVGVTDETDYDLVRTTVKQRNYTFPIAIDATRAVGQQFGVTATPTLVILNPQNQIAWITSGLSPTLELRLRAYLNP